MESDLIKIEIDIYRRCNNLPKYSTAFQDTYHFDNECGLSYHSNKGRGEAGYFYFELIDEQKYFLAKIKYGI